VIPFSQPQAIAAARSAPVSTTGSPARASAATGPARDGSASDQARRTIPTPVRAGGSSAAASPSGASMARP